MKTLRHSILSLTAILLLLTGCKKENSWTTDVYLDDKGSNSLRVEGHYELTRNDNYVYIGVCWSNSPDPTVTDSKIELQSLASTIEHYEIENLDPATTYYVRSYIGTNGAGVIYSETKNYTTEAASPAPCDSPDNEITVAGSTYSTDHALYDSEGDYYEMYTSCSFGDLRFIFSERPTKNKNYLSVHSSSDLNTNTVKFSGVLGLGWTCYYGAGQNQEIYVRINEEDKISIQVCDLSVNTSSDCTDTYLITGKMTE